jgi:AraC family transcriptional regulator of adaptative response/methylated-DNA-[protein]-cysteine methyltransferase
MTIRYGYCGTPFGRCQMALTELGICDLGFVDGESAKGPELDLGKKWVGAKLIKDDRLVRSTAHRIFGTATGPERTVVKLDLRGTNFQVKVWQALLRIPEGAVVSYSNLAGFVGRPDAVRAVAGAVGENPVAWIVPCHRVLRSTGEIGGYRWGVTRKKMMLAREMAGSAVKKGI